MNFENIQMMEARKQHYDKEMLDAHEHPHPYPYYQPYVHHHHHGKDGHGHFIVSWSHPAEDVWMHHHAYMGYPGYSQFGYPMRFDMAGAGETQQQDVRQFPFFPGMYAPYWHPYYRPYPYVRPYGFGVGPFII